LVLPFGCYFAHATSLPRRGIYVVDRPGRTSRPNCA
jgi:hypothetical protein